MINHLTCTVISSQKKTTIKCNTFTTTKKLIYNLSKLPPVITHLVNVDIIYWGKSESTNFCANKFWSKFVDGIITRHRFPLKHLSWKLLHAVCAHKLCWCELAPVACRFLAVAFSKDWLRPGSLANSLPQARGLERLKVKGTLTRTYSKSIIKLSFECNVVKVKKKDCGEAGGGWEESW